MDAAADPQRSAALFSTARFRARELTEADAPCLQSFFEANPDYFTVTGGAPPRPDEALQEMRDVPPVGFSYSRMMLVGWLDGRDEMVAMATVVFDLFTEGVFHVGLFIVETRRWGEGIGRECFAALEAGARQAGCRWLRLGVVIGNTRAEDFWHRCGLVELRQRHGVEIGVLKQDLRTMAKPLADAAIADYLALVKRDNPGEP